MLDRLAPTEKQDPFAGLARNHWRVIAADPPWTYKVRTPAGEGRSASRHYKTMGLGELTQLPVKELAAKDSHLFLWAPSSHLPQALFLMDWWGFAYSSVGFAWIKTNPSAPGLFFDRNSFFTGMGHTTRKNAELCLLGRRGSPRRLRKDIRELIIAPRREHSRKPDEFFDRVTAYAAGPYLELFSRQQRPGWECWGNEVGKFGVAK